MKRIRGGAGLGDALYIRGVVEILNERVEVCTHFPELFSDLDVGTAPFSRANIDYLAHYAKRKDETTNQWEDVCIQAGVKPRPMRFSWKPDREYDYVVICAPHTPMKRKDRFGREVLPNKKVFQEICEDLKGTRLLVGNESLFDVPHDEDLRGKTSLKDLLNIGATCRGGVGQCSWIVPLMEGFNKPLLAIWSSAIEKSEHHYVRRIIPEKILSGEKSLFLYDDWQNRDKIVEIFNQRTSQKEV